MAPTGIWLVTPGVEPPLKSKQIFFSQSWLYISRARSLMKTFLNKVYIFNSAWPNFKAMAP